MEEGRAWVPSTGLLAAAAGIILGATFTWWWTSSPSQTGAGAPTTSSAAPASVPVAPIAVAPAAATPVGVATIEPSPAIPAPPTTQRIVRKREPGDDPTPDISDYINEGERPTMGEVISRLQQAGVQGGLAAFSPPGTRPPLVGLAVPEDYVLPEGYVRHHQATDDGQRIEAILMFAPDRQFFDAAGQPIAIPKDRVVPPELAPPGLPMRRIVVPPPTDGS